MKKTIAWLSLVSAFTWIGMATVYAEDTAHKTHTEHKHKHGDKKCAHKAEKHGDHTDYEHDGHHHKTHADHMDECNGPEADAKSAEQKK